MRIFSRTIFHAHVDDESHAEVAQDVVIFCGRSRADEKIIGDGGEVHERNRIIGIESQILHKSKRLWIARVFLIFTFFPLPVEPLTSAAYIFEQELSSLNELENAKPR